MESSALSSVLIEAKFSDTLTKRVLDRFESYDDLLCASSEQFEDVLGVDGSTIKPAEAARFRVWLREQLEARGEAAAAAHSDAVASSGAGSAVEPGRSADLAAQPLPAPLPALVAPVDLSHAASSLVGSSGLLPAISLADIYNANAVAAMYNNNNANNANAAANANASSNTTATSMPMAPLATTATTMPLVTPDMSAFANVSYMTNVASTANMSAFPAAIPFQNHPAFFIQPQYPTYVPANFANGGMMASSPVISESVVRARTKHPLVILSSPQAAQAFTNSSMAAPIPPDVAAQLVSHQMQRRSGRWSDEEHEQFLKLMNQYGRSWTKIAHVMKTRTEPQVRSHAQKYFLRLRRLEKAAASNDDNQTAAHDGDEEALPSSGGTNDRQRQLEASPNAAATTSSAKRGASSNIGAPVTQNPNDDSNKRVKVLNASLMTPMGALPLMAPNSAQTPISNTDALVAAATQAALQATQLAAQSR